MSLKLIRSFWLLLLTLSIYGCATQSGDTSNDFSIRFSVQGGEVSYLGNLHFFIEKDTFNYSIIDSSERDFDVFLKSIRL